MSLVVKLLVATIMKKNFLLFLALSITLLAEAQENNNTEETTEDGNSSIKTTIKLSELPKEVLDSYNKLNKKHSVKEVNVYSFYWEDQTQYYDYHEKLDSLTVKGDVPFILPEYYELVYLKSNYIFKSIYSKYGKLIHTSKLINNNELPKAVVKSYKKSSYKDWDIVGQKEEINRKKPNVIIYRLIIRKGEETQIVHFDQNGNDINHKNR